MMNDHQGEEPSLNQENNQAGDGNKQGGNDKKGNDSENNNEGNHY